MGEFLDSAELFRRHAPFVSGLIRRLGVPPSELDDHLQEVFLVAHRNGGYEPGAARPTTYLASIACLLVHTERRKRRVRAFVQADEERIERAVGTSNPEHFLEQREQLRRVDGLMERIHPKQRAVLLSEFGGETVLAIASS